MALSVDENTTGSPFWKIRPLSGWIWPARIDIKVDLPAPFSPSRARIEPWRIESEMSRLACTAPKALLTPSRRMRGSDALTTGYRVVDSGWTNCDSASQGKRIQVS